METGNTDSDDFIDDRKYKESGLVCEKCGYTDSLKCRVWDSENDADVITILCGEHAAKEGYCCCCGEFCAGMTSFDFHHPGYCDNCYDEVKSNYGENENEDEDDDDYVGYVTYPGDDDGPY